MTAALLVIGFTGIAQAAPGGDATVEQVSFTVGSGMDGEGVATCPAGTRAVGGGVGNTAGIGEGYLRFSGPVDGTGRTAQTDDGDIARSWYANVHNSGDPKLYRVSALCSASSDAIVEQTTLTFANNEGAGVATCPAGTRAVGGGAGATADTGASRIQVSGPLDETGTTANTDDGDIARFWYANVLNLAGAKRYRVFALCSAGSDAIIERESLAVAGPDADGAATCPAGRRAVGGGVGTTADFVYSEVQLSGPLDETGATATTDPGDAARSWQASVYNAGQPRDYLGFAVCATDDPGAGVPGGVTPADTPSDTIKPVLTALNLAPRRFPAARSGPSLAGTGGGARVRYTLSEAALVTFVVLRPRSGRRIGSKCVAMTPANRGRDRCTRFVALPGSFSHRGRAGSNGFVLRGRLSGRTLSVGSYRLRAVARDAARNTSRRKETAFHIS